MSGARAGVWSGTEVIVIRPGAFAQTVPGDSSPQAVRRAGEGDRVAVEGARLGRKHR